jgi:hypothetical protein
MVHCRIAPLRLARPGCLHAEGGEPAWPVERNLENAREQPRLRPGNLLKLYIYGDLIRVRHLQDETARQILRSEAFCRHIAFKCFIVAIDFGQPVLLSSKRIEVAAAKIGCLPDRL